ncbi:MAG: hypothetical protein LBT27_05570 [Prevotellaceae bacterium]|jgi:hypothetical protein|nr:hypothetical protein [Prevotellaceae bacterium]
MNFYDEIKSFITENYDGEISTNQILNDMYTNDLQLTTNDLRLTTYNLQLTLFIPDKKIVFLLIPLPAFGFEDSQKMFFQNLSIATARQNLQLIVIWEDNWIAKNEIIRQRILAHLGKFVRIHGRLCEIRRITKTLTDEFLLQNHLHNSPQAKHKYGLFYKNQLVAAATFSSGRPIIRNQKIYRSYELVRFANYRNYVVYGGIGKIISHFIAEQNPDDIMSYADVDWSAGKSYEKLGFKFIEYTEPQKFYLNTKTYQRYYPKKLPQELVAEFSKQSLSLDDFLTKHNIFTIYNSGNKKYLLALK